MRLAEDRRKEIAANAREAVQAVKENQKILCVLCVSV